MILFHRCCSALLVLSVGLLCASPAVSRNAAKLGSTDSPVKIGMCGSLFKDQPETIVKAMMQPFGMLMKMQTGMTGELIAGGEAENVGRMLANNEVQLGVFHGYEFAWAREQFPKLQPLMIAVNQQRHLRAVLVVSNEDAPADLDDLRGKCLAFPKGAKDHCRMFLESRCTECGQTTPEEFFTKITSPADAEEALDDVVDGIAHCVLVDAVGLECYKRRKPARFAKLKSLMQSEAFPAGVVAYCPGVLSEETLNRFRAGMVNANKSVLGKQLLTMWKLTGFETVPDDYDDTLYNIAKCYPSPKKVKE